MVTEIKSEWEQDKEGLLEGYDSWERTDPDGTRLSVELTPLGHWMTTFFRKGLVVSVESFFPSRESAVKACEDAAGYNVDSQDFHE